jgi:hypothetical protein
MHNFPVIDVKITIGLLIMFTQRPGALVSFVHACKSINSLFFNNNKKLQGVVALKRSFNNKVCYPRNAWIAKYGYAYAIP